MADSQYEQQGNFYDHGYNALAMGEAGFPDFKIVDYVADISGQRILNIGGGNASDTWFLAQKNEVHVFDASATAVQQASEHHVQGMVGDVAETLPYADNSFDIVMLKDILEHIYDPFALLLEAKRIVKPTGSIIISLPNHFYLPFRLRLLCGDNLIWKSLLHNHKQYFEEWNYMHIRFFTWGGVKKMLAKAELKLVKPYWDFGTLAHYNDPLMYEAAFRLNHKTITSRRQWLMYRVLVPGYKIFNTVFPKVLRAKIVGLCPGLLCAGFYIRVKK